MIIQGDCLEVLRKIPIGKVKCIFSDPPDNIGMKYTDYDDSRKPEDYYNWLHLIILEAMPKCQVFWFTYYPKHDLEISWLMRDTIKYRHPGFTVDRFIWRYTFSQYNDHDCSYGYRPILRVMRNNAVLYPDAIREVSKRQLLGDSRAAGLRVPDNVWSIPRVVGNSPERCDWIPTQLPIRLMERIISFSISDDEVITDLFGGSGSCLYAAQKLGRKCAIIEKDQESCRRISERSGVPITLFQDGFSWAL